MVEKYSESSMNNPEGLLFLIDHLVHNYELTEEEKNLLLQDKKHISSWEKLAESDSGVGQNILKTLCFRTELRIDDIIGTDVINNKAS